MDIVAIHRDKKLALASGGELGHMRRLLDVDGDDTDDINLAVVAIVQFSIGWCVVNLNDYEAATVH